MRYIRQTILPEIGETGQAKLGKASILCVGAGGLGSPALLYLAAAGVGKIGIIDFDCIDVTNLQRQVLFTTENIGQAKAEKAKEQLQKLNPDITIKVYNTQLNTENAPELFKEYELIIDGTDNFETKFLINDASVKYGKPWVYGAIQGFDGQVSVFHPNHGPCYRCLYPEIPKTQIANCAEAGVIGAIAGIIGTTQAMQAIQLIVGHENFEPLIGKLWTLDARTMETRILTIPKNNNCRICNEQEKGNIVLQYQPATCATISELTVETFMRKKDVVVFDVREIEEWETGHIEDAQNLPLSKIQEGKLPQTPQHTEILLYCQKGKRSLQAAQILRKYFPNIYSLSGGFEAWIKARN